jgi:general secretion pathway protein E
MATFGRLIQLEHGLILVTGPTGSGKSTTLYAALQQINTKDSNVLTLEDPIEYQLSGISQTQVSEKKGMTFARGLRSVLRQDPDIIMIGEIRDHETAVMAIQSALTGHLVFSTLHTNDAASAVTRLLDLGIEPYLVASSLEAVLAQRLVRKICPECREPFVPSDDDLLRMGVDRVRLAGKPLWRGKGCPNCRQSGHSGRLGIFELLVIDADVRLKIQQRANATEIREVALAHGMRLLQEDGIGKILSGATTLDEVVRVATRADILHADANDNEDEASDGQQTDELEPTEALAA